MSDHAQHPRTPVTGSAGAGPRDTTELTAVLGIDLDPDLLTVALTHRSYSYEQGGVPHNERLEFLGDAVLGIVVTDALYRDFPDLPEGRLAKMRASVVQMRALAEVARGIGPGGLGAYLRLGRGEETTGGRDKSSILADGLEALLGAIYMSRGPRIAHEVVHNLFDEIIAAAALQGAALDWKTSLQELTAELGLGVPEYLIESEGPDHERRFTARAIVADEQFDACPGRNKKEAEQAAASTAWTALRARVGSLSPPTDVSLSPPTDVSLSPPTDVSLSPPADASNGRPTASPNGHPTASSKRQPTASSNRQPDAAADGVHPANGSTPAPDQS